MKKTLFTALVLASALSAGSVSAQIKTDDMKGMDAGKKPAASQRQVHTATGVVKKVDLKSGTVMLAHEPVNSLSWPAMTMSFAVTDRKWLDQLTPGRKVRFEFVQQGDDYIITSFK